MEGCKYKIEVTFRVQHDIVSGLKYTNAVYRKGVRVDKQTTMLGSFGPQGDASRRCLPASRLGRCSVGHVGAWRLQGQVSSF
jgi:Rho GDP-dissociation inhibitor